MWQGKSQWSPKTRRTKRRQIDHRMLSMRLKQSPSSIMYFTHEELVQAGQYPLVSSVLLSAIAFALGTWTRSIGSEVKNWLSVISLLTELRGQEVGGKGRWMEKLGGFRVTMWKICPGQWSAKVSTSYTTDAREGNSVATAPDPVPEDVIAKNIDYRQQVFYCWSCSRLRSLFICRCCVIFWKKNRNMWAISEDYLISTCNHYTMLTCEYWMFYMHIVYRYLAKYDGKDQDVLKLSTRHRRIIFYGCHKTSDWSVNVLKGIFAFLPISSLPLIMRKDS